MFGRLARLVVGNPWKVIGVWALATIAIVAFAPSLGDVQQLDQAGFLPDRYESIQAQNLAKQAFGQGGTNATATIVVKRDDGKPFTAANQAKVGELATRLQKAGIDRVLGAATGPLAVSPNKLVQLVNVQLNGQAYDPAVPPVVQHIRDAARPVMAGTGLSLRVTGDVALSLDNQDAFNNALSSSARDARAHHRAAAGHLSQPGRGAAADRCVGLVSPCLRRDRPWSSRLFGMQVDQSLPTILTVVLYGVGTDYIVFLLFRYRERLRAGDAQARARHRGHPGRRGHRVGRRRDRDRVRRPPARRVRRLPEPRPRPRHRGDHHGDRRGHAGAGDRLAHRHQGLLAVEILAARPEGQRVPAARPVHRTPTRAVAVASGGVMVALALGVFGLKIDYDQIGQLPASTESARGLEDLQQRVPGWRAQPDHRVRAARTPVQASTRRPRAVTPNVAQVPGVAADACCIRSRRQPRHAQRGRHGRPDQPAAGRPARTPRPHSTWPVTAPAPGRPMLRPRPARPRWSVGSARSSPTSASANDRDLWVIFPVAGLLIAVILGLLLRSLVAPVYLHDRGRSRLLATLGATVLAFQGIGGRPGLSFSAADHPVPVRGRDRHRLQHPDDRPAARGGPGRQRPAHRRRPGRSNTADRRSARPD